MVMAEHGGGKSASLLSILGFLTALNQNHSLLVRLSLDFGIATRTCQIGRVTIPSRISAAAATYPSISPSLLTAVQLLLQAMLIKVKTLTGKEIELDIDPDDKITRIKEKVEEQSGVPPPQQRLIFGGRQMADDKTAKEFNITAGTVLHLVLALRGGC